MHRATLGAGCFWGVESYFAKLDGILDLSVGYAGGKLKNPDYKTVCTGSTGHVEVVDFQFDLQIITYQEILNAFWLCHNPTQLNRQGHDIGSQYRSVIFTHTDKQFIDAHDSLNAYQKKLSQKIVTSIEKYTNYWKAEEYHQAYLAKNRSIF